MISVEMQGGRICLLCVVNAVMGQNTREPSKYLYSCYPCNFAISVFIMMIVWYLRYCMREMLDKVPEGDWLCEECKTLEQAEKRRQEKIARMDKNEKNNSSDQASENLNSSEDRRTKSSTKIAPKRPRDDDDAEVSSKIKKPALESVVGSPKTSNSNRIAALSRESSFKNLDRGKLQSPHHSSSETVPINGTAELAKPASDPRLHNVRGYGCRL